MVFNNLVLIVHGQLCCQRCYFGFLYFIVAGSMLEHSPGRSVGNSPAVNLIPSTSARANISLMIPLLPIFLGIAALLLCYILEVELIAGGLEVLELLIEGLIFIIFPR